ncbi:unnamed protein product [Owenia fusiformis]|uniref:TGF-beta family profile domain-containing protein n=1 Tax=Owenia fusiformis TaxID=6347 RepID=A0A8S4PX80_OWEFU|nr:unnamed protein product [Owenia fusiformis]
MGNIKVVTFCASVILLAKLVCSTKQRDSDLRQMRLMRLEIIKSEILKQLRLERPPNVTGIPIPRNPPFIQEIERLTLNSRRESNMAMDDIRWDTLDEDSSHTETSEEFVLAERCDEPLRHFDDKSIRFSFLNSSRLTILNASLYVYTRNHTETGDSNSFLKINNIKRSGEVERVAIRQINDVHRNGYWHKFDILAQVQRWIRRPNSNLGLEVKANSVNGRSLAITHPDKDEEKPLRPVIYMTVQRGIKYRKKRMNYNRDCSDFENSDNCCRESLIVDFSSFGWDWIVAPKMYNAYFCTGECPYNFLQHYHHSYLSQLQRGVNGNGTGLCCTPGKYSNLSLLYFPEDGSVRATKLEVLQNMKVERCHCA